MGVTVLRSSSLSSWSSWRRRPGRVTPMIRRRRGPGLHHLSCARRCSRRGGGCGCCIIHPSVRRSSFKILVIGRVRIGTDYRPRRGVSVQAREISGIVARKIIPLRVSSCCVAAVVLVVVMAAAVIVVVVVASWRRRQHAAT